MHFLAEAKMPVFTIVIVVSVLLFLSVSDSVISAARTGRSKSQDSGL
jgi:hypothetical protein